MDKKLGMIVKSIRKRNNMTLKQVSEKTGLSISFLSQVERSKSSVTLTSLRKISEALGVSLSDFFQTENKDKSKMRKHTEYKLDSFSFVNLSGDLPNPLFEPFLITLFPGNNQAFPYSHRGQEFLYILEGILTVIHDNQEYELYPGDSLHIESTDPHIWFNNTNSPVKLLLINASNSNKDS